MADGLLDAGLDGGLDAPIGTVHLILWCALSIMCIEKNRKNSAKGKLNWLMTDCTKEEKNSAFQGAV